MSTDTPAPTKKMPWGAIAAVITTAASLGIPALVWGGAISARVDGLEQSYKELHVDLRDIDRKLDRLLIKESGRDDGRHR